MILQEKLLPKVQKGGVLTLFVRNYDDRCESQREICHRTWHWDDVRLLRIKEKFRGDLMSKNQWSYVLGVSLRTLQRWEREYIDSPNELVRFARCYHVSYSLKPTPLDGYKRFVLTIIYFLKAGWLTGYQETGQGVIKWLIKNQDNISRSNFQDWITKE